MDTFTITYEPGAMNGERGFHYEIRSRGRVRRTGWSRGKRHHAETMARADIRELENRRAA